MGVPTHRLSSKRAHHWLNRSLPTACLFSFPLFKPYLQFSLHNGFRLSSFQSMRESIEQKLDPITCYDRSIGIVPPRVG